MRILHYALGFPPYRTGGLTKFCMDLMVEQSKEGHHIALMWPGQMGFIDKNISIKNRGYVSLQNQSLQSFEVINPLPISFDEGIVDFSAFTANDGEKTYENFLTEYCPDIIHVHTLMGLHKSFLEVANKKKIRLVFTAHDFFPICPKVTMFRNGGVCTSVMSCKECDVCNATALGLGKIRMLQSPIYRKMKDSSMVKRLRKRHRDNYLSEKHLHVVEKSMGTTENFLKLRKYYYSLLELMDIIHYNSSLTKSVYESIFTLPNSAVIEISHADIKDCRKKKKFDKQILKIRYLGPYSVAKGYFILKDALDRLWTEGRKFRLDIHFNPEEIMPYMRIHDRYSYEELEDIFNDTDILVVPSVLYETFGYTALEALSYGVPVIISGNVGAKNILTDGAGIIVNDIDSDKLYAVFQHLSVHELEKMNQEILKKQKIPVLADMARKIEEICYKNT